MRADRRTCCARGVRLLAFALYSAAHWLVRGRATAGKAVCRHERSDTYVRGYQRRTMALGVPRSSFVFLATHGEGTGYYKMTYRYCARCLVRADCSVFELQRSSSLQRYKARPRRSICSPLDMPQSPTWPE
ncbi:hypothetical protein IE81DRAFT_247319 [Ceraceosorus guamensis]|uniref:Secreted protein n=1 Tax=Ceraceosorus guamensis TaxID=1522189 RepID=A0A316VRZ2_9BASI|nr:hypothetical protein IE81DRAFT_247319 [Ceraceosorus guamensis]PWN39984.1 hypothetical protein IE81DRAFT_247319 [Ceraceosorus guamensis]